MQGNLIWLAIPQSSLLPGLMLEDITKLGSKNASEVTCPAYKGRSQTRQTTYHGILRIKTFCTHSCKFDKGDVPTQAASVAVLAAHGRARGRAAGTVLNLLWHLPAKVLEVRLHTTSTK